MAREAFHVVPHGDGWAVKREGVERPHSTHDTQKAAIDAARDAAHEGDELVVHRTDGTIRENVTVAGASARAGNGNGGNGGNANERETRDNRESRRDRDDDRPRYSDIWSVGSRVSWSAIVAGVVIALASAALLTALAAAIEIPLLDNMSPNGVAWYNIVAAVFILLVSMFLGGYVASRLTTRETSGESVIYGVLVWGAFSALATFGLGAGTRLGIDAFNSARTANDRAAANADRGGETRVANPVTDNAVNGTKPEDAQKRENAEAAGNQIADRAQRMSATSKGWTTFLALLLPLLSAIGGALAGCGADPTRRVRRGETPGNAPVENRIAQYERAGA